MSWQVESAQSEEVAFLDHLSKILDSEYNKAPEREIRLGSSKVFWQAVSPEEILLRAEGGSHDDRILARQIVASQLEGFGYRLAEAKMPCQYCGLSIGHQPWCVERNDNQNMQDPGGILPGMQVKVISGPHQGTEGEVVSYEGGDLFQVALKMEWDSFARSMVTYDRRQLQPLNNGPEFFQHPDPMMDSEPGATTFPESWGKTAEVHYSDWSDVMQKAVRLVKSGQVTVLRNSPQNVVGHVIGDHGEYQCEFSRDDPNSNVIVMWNCECPWNTFAFDRSRKWKKFEGRVCAHVLALYFQSKRTPLDQDTPQNYQVPKGQKGPQVAPGQMGMPGMGAPAGGQGGLSLIPMVPKPSPSRGQGQATPGGMGMGMGQGQQQMMFPDATNLLSQPKPAIAPPQPMGVIPPSMQEQLQLPIPGSTPHGMQAPPNSVSVPGARQPNPFNPLQSPGVFSRLLKTGAVYARYVPNWRFSDYQNGDSVKLVGGPELGQAEDPAGNPSWEEIPQNSRGEVLSQDESTGWVECAFPLSGGPHSAHLVKVFVSPDRLQKLDVLPGQAFKPKIR